MAGKNRKIRGIVLRKTKLGEKDLIVSLLDESGSLAKAVAKGARKPGGSLAARMELFSVVDVELAQGRNLDVVTGAAFAGDVPRATFGVEQAACASVLAELLSTLAQEGLSHDRLFDMSEAAFCGMARETPANALALAASALLKALAYAGFRPSFRNCVACGCDVALGPSAGMVPFSIQEGGVTCNGCEAPPDSVRTDAAVLQCADALMRARFQDVVEAGVDAGAAFAVLELIRQWTRFHVGKNLKSLDFLFACGLF